MYTMQRTQIYLDTAQIQQLRLEAHKMHVPVSELIRKAVSRFLAESVSSSEWSRDSLEKTVGKLKLSSSDASTRHDDYLYG